MATPIATKRLNDAVAAVAPIDSVSVVGQTAIISYQASATAQQKAAADAVVAAFNWTAAADVTWAAQQAKVLAALNLDNGQLQNGTNIERLVRALALVVLDEVNLLRANAGLSQRTAAQVVTAIKAKITATAE